MIDDKDRKVTLVRRIASVLVLAVLILILNPSAPTPQTPNAPSHPVAPSYTAHVRATPADPSQIGPVQGGAFEVTTLGPTNAGYEVVADEVLVKLVPTLNADQAQALARRLGSRIRGQGSYSGLYRFELPPGRSLDEFQEALQPLSEVLSVRPEAVARGAGDKAYRSRQWDLDRVDPISDANDAPPELQSVVVAILDTGIAYEDYQDGSAQYRKLPELSYVHFQPGYDFINNDAHPNDDHQHGTHVASIMAGQGKTVGVAPGVGLMPIKVLDRNKRGTELQVIEGLYYAVDHGADIINMSLSFGLGYFPSAEFQDAIDYAVTNGVVLVAASGNNGVWGVPYPAAFPDVIAVGASALWDYGSTVYELRAPYSNYGYAVDLAAPGGRMDKDLNRDGYPDGILAPTFRLNKPTDLGYWYYAGTSQAAAQVSGAAARLLANGAQPEDVAGLLAAGAKSTDNIYYFLSPYAGSGSIQVKKSLNAIGTAYARPPQYYVNILPRLVKNSYGVRAIARVLVLDNNGKPVPSAYVLGSWYGSITYPLAIGYTNSAGIAEIGSPYARTTSNLSIGLQVDRVMLYGSRLAGTPVQFYALSPAQADVYQYVMNQAGSNGAILLFRVPSDDAPVNALFSTQTWMTSNIVKPMGPGSRTGAMAMVFDDAFAPQVTQPASGTATTVTVNFQGALYSGRGSITSLKGTRVDASAPRLGSVSRYFLFPLDPAMAGADLDHCYPVLNVHPSRYRAVNTDFGNRVARSVIGNGFLASTLGNGFLASTLGNGFLASTLGNGFLASTLGNGFLASTIGNAYSESVSGMSTQDLGAEAMSLEDEDGDGGQHEAEVDPASLSTTEDSQTALPDADLIP